VGNYIMTVETNKLLWLVITNYNKNALYIKHMSISNTKYNNL